MTSHGQMPNVVSRAFDTAELPDHWAAITRIALAPLKHSTILCERVYSQSQTLFEQYLQHGYFPNCLLREALSLPEATGILFFNRLYRHAELTGIRPPSPLQDQPDDTWMSHSGYCFVNVRATGALPSVTGNFINATRLLPLLRVRAIHLCPFFESVFGIVYAQDSFAIVSDKVVHAQYEALGVSRYDQLRYFIDCCHLLGKAVAFDLTPHTSGFSKLCLDRPELFRWLRFDPEYNGLQAGQTVDDQYDEACQKTFIDHIRSLARQVCDEYELPGLENTESDPAKINAVKEQVMTVLRSYGYYPVVPHTWNGVGLPGLKSYDKAGNYPIWDYRDAEGNDQSAHGIGIHASFKFNTGLVANASPYYDPDKRDQWRSQPWAETWDYLGELFPRMHREYGFDFLRIDYVDHVFEGAVEKDGEEIVLCEQLSPGVLRSIARAAKRAFPAAGMLADHVGHDIDLYRTAGFATIWGWEAMAPVDAHNMRQIFDLNRKLAAWHSETPGYGTVAYTVDIHDTGHPEILGKELPDRDDRAVVALRHFLARFSTAGIGSRPKYETLGSQDLSGGIYRANNEEVSLTWSDDRAAMTAYHLIEDAYESCRDQWATGRLTRSQVFDDHCWWQIQGPDQRVAYLACTWIGTEYRHDQAMQHTMHSVIPIASAPEGPGGPDAPDGPDRPGMKIGGLEVVLGMRPASDPGQVESIALDSGHIEWHLDDSGELHVRWPNLTSWLFRIRYHSDS